MIAFNELIKGSVLSDIPIQHQQNLDELLKRINVIRAAWGKPMLVTSGYRSLQDHLRIYSQRGITDRSRIPMASQHLSGEAVDISDPNKELQAWVLQNVALLEQVGLWCESFDSTVNWAHFQIRPPKSGNRFFKP